MRDEYDGPVLSCVMHYMQKRLSVGEVAYLEDSCFEGAGPTGARITWIGFAVSSALQAALILALGDEDAYGFHTRDPFPYGGAGGREPLIAEETGLRPPLSSV
jgi:hypothetical protein